MEMCGWSPGRGFQGFRAGLELPGRTPGLKSMWPKSGTLPDKRVVAMWPLLSIP